MTSHPNSEGERTSTGEFGTSSMGVSGFSAAGGPDITSLGMLEVSGAVQEPGSLARFLDFVPLGSQSEEESSWLGPRPGMTTLAMEPGV